MSEAVISLLRTLVIVLISSLALAALAHAQSEPPRKSPLGIAVPDRGAQARAPAAEQAPQGIFDRTWVWIVQAQREMTSAMTGAVRRLQTGDAVSSTLFLALVSFLYGVLHAVGPGHGKFVISSYALANERTVRRGILLSFMAAFVQALSAIVIVGILAILFRATSLQIKATEARLETLSWGLVALIGAWLLYSQLRPLLAARAAHARGHGHGHDHHHGHDHAHAHDHHDHHAHADPHHVHDEHCGHLHMAEPRQLEGAWSWRHAWSLALSIGVRPCTGAIAVLIFALSIGLFWAGVFATFAMAVGTAITVSTLAAIAVGSRELAARIAGRDSVWGTRIQRAAGIAGAAAVFMLGATFFIASIVSPAPL